VIEEYMDPSDLEEKGLINPEIGNPNLNHPSDHYSLAYKVYLEKYLDSKMQNNNKIPLFNSILGNIIL